MPVVPLRTLSQNALYWVWMRQLAVEFSKGERFFAEDNMHDLCRHLHLGYEDIIVGHTEIPHQLKSTTKLTKNQMSDYMMKIDNWAIDLGILLPRPDGNEYTKYMEAAR